MMPALMFPVNVLQGSNLGQKQLGLPMLEHTI